MADKEKADMRESMVYPSPVDGYEMFSWPEFLAFAKRAGLDLSLPIRTLEFRMVEGEVVTFHVTYDAVDMDKAQSAYRPGKK